MFRRGFPSRVRGDFGGVDCQLVLKPVCDHFNAVIFLSAVGSKKSKQQQRFAVARSGAKHSIEKTFDISRTKTHVWVNMMKVLMTLLFFPYALFLAGGLV